MVNGYAGLKFRLPLNTATKSVHHFASRLNSDNHGSSTTTNGYSLLQKLTAAELFGAVPQTTRYYEDKYVSTDGMYVYIVIQKNVAQNG